MCFSVGMLTGWPGGFGDMDTSPPVTTGRIGDGRLEKAAIDRAEAELTTLTLRIAQNSRERQTVGSPGNYC